MRLELTGRHVEITPVLRRLVTTKLARLERLLNDSALSAQVVLSSERRARRADVTLHARGEKFLHGDGEATVWEPALKRACDKIAQQAKKVKGKWQERKRGVPRSASPGGSIDGTAVPEGVSASVSPRPKRLRTPRIVRASNQPLKAMTAVEAAREVQAQGDGIVIFRDVETAAISVLFRRATGELTLVATDV
ncbi:MAG: ribosome-associated translation inhibitor RaiA [Vicinamibacterales bacterium]